LIFWEKLGVRVETVVGSLGMGYKVRLTKLPNVHNPYVFSPISKYKGFSVPNTTKPSNFYSVNAPNIRDLVDQTPQNPPIFIV